MGSKPCSPAVEHGTRGSDLPAYVANGLIGLRVREVPFLAGAAILNGVVGMHADERIEAAVPIPYPLAGDIGLGETWLSEQPWAVTDLRQSYDFETAELTSAFTFHAQGVPLRVETTTFASRSDATLVLQQTLVSADADCTLRWRAVVDTRVAPGRVAERLVGQAEPVGDGSLLWMAEGGLSSCGIACHSQCAPPAKACRSGAAQGSGPLFADYEIELKAGRPVYLTQIAALVPSIAHRRPREEAVRRLARGVRLGFDKLREKNRDIWQAIWRGRIVVHGASRRHQSLIDAGFFYLNCSMHLASPAATSMFGLASWHNYHYYYGHVMWDIDAFCVPPLLLLQPDAARSLLDFRARHVEAARRHARLDGRSGMRFPWQAAPLSGEEAAPGDGPAADYAAHLSLHVARAFSLHAEMTGDHHYLRNTGWPIISGVSDWLSDRVSITKRGAEMLAINGPAEVPEPPDNDSFTLMAAADVLTRALRAAKAIGAEAPQSWRQLLDRLYQPRRSDGVIPSHDGFHISEPKGATPSPLAGFFPLDYPASRREREATLALFLARWRDYVGSPMLPAFYPAWAAMAGDRQLALDLFEEGYAAYDAGRFHQCLEYRTDHPDSQVPAGPFMANIGAMLTTMLLGLPGLQIDDGDPSDWAKRSVVLPAGWSAITVDRIWIRGEPMRLVAGQGDDRAQILPA